jgi:aspartate/methionine/tyrosine aminotransferase
MRPTTPSSPVLRSRWLTGLKKLSELILRERRNLIPHIHSLPKHDSVRTDRLWRENTRFGTFMSNGGVGRAFLSAEDVRRSDSDASRSEVIQRNLGEYNLYRTDRPESTKLPQDKLKQFLTDEGLIDPSSDREKISVEFSLGSHEAFTRLLRCIRHDKKNTGLLYPVGGYGLLVRAAATVEVGKYDVCLVQADREHGEKILLSSLEKEAARHPRAKTLYLESKTMCGAIYSREELEEIVKFCKEKDMFFILDSAHANMEFDPSKKFPDLASICQAQDYTKYAQIFTGSKTYGLERGRVGFTIFGDKDLAKKFYGESSKVMGSMSDVPIELASALILSPPEARKKFRDERLQYHESNMNLLIAYVEGIDSPNVDGRFKEGLRKEIPPEYQNGIEGMKLIYRPDGGIQLKVDMSGLCQKYFGNIKMFNSEIFSYALHEATDVVTLHSYQLMDEVGNAMRLSFSVREDVHKGMQLMQDFVREALTDQPSPNPYMSGVALAEDFIFPTEAEMDHVAAESRIGAEGLKLEEERLHAEYRDRAKSMLPEFYQKFVTEALENEIVEKAAETIQNKWREAKSKWLAAVEKAGVVPTPDRLPRVESLASLVKEGGAAAVDASPARVGSSLSSGPSPIRPLRRPMSNPRVTPSSAERVGVVKESPPEGLQESSSESEGDEEVVLKCPPLTRRISYPQPVAWHPETPASVVSARKGMPPFSPMRSDDGRVL